MYHRSLLTFFGSRVYFVSELEKARVSKKYAGFSFPSNGDWPINRYQIVIFKSKFRGTNQLTARRGGILVAENIINLDVKLDKNGNLMRYFFKEMMWKLFKRKSKRYYVTRLFEIRCGCVIEKSHSERTYSSLPWELWLKTN